MHPNSFATQARLQHQSEAPHFLSSRGLSSCFSVSFHPHSGPKGMSFFAPYYRWEKRGTSSYWIRVRNLIRGLTHLGPSAPRFPSQYPEMWLGRKVAFHQNAGDLGRWWTRGPQNHLWKFCSAMKAFKGEKECHLSCSLRGGQSHCHPPLRARVDASSPSSRCHPVDTVWLHGWSQGITEGSLCSFITESSVLLLWSMERTDKLGKELGDQKIWKWSSWCGSAD